MFILGWLLMHKWITIYVLCVLFYWVATLGLSFEIIDRLKGMGVKFKFKHKRGKGSIRVILIGLVPVLNLIYGLIYLIYWDYLVEVVTEKLHSLSKSDS